jgi:hypothetical protein
MKHYVNDICIFLYMIVWNKYCCKGDKENRYFKFVQKNKR